MNTGEHLAQIGRAVEDAVAFDDTTSDPWRAVVAMRTAGREMVLATEPGAPVPRGELERLHARLDASFEERRFDRDVGQRKIVYLLGYTLRGIIEQLTYLELSPGNAAVCACALWRSIGKNRRLSTAPTFRSSKIVDDVDSLYEVYRVHSCGDCGAYWLEDDCPESDPTVKVWWPVYARIGNDRWGFQMVKPEELDRLRERVRAFREDEPSDYVRALVDLAEALPASDEKVERWAEAAEIYKSRFANEAEAVAAYEKVLDVLPNHGVACEFLAEAYERRRSYDKLVQLRSRRAATLQGEARLAAHKEVARLASDRLARPELAVQQWEAVLALDPDDAEARAALLAAAERVRRPSTWARLREWLKS